MLATLTAAILAANAPTQGDSFVHLFEWPYQAIANECEQHLAPAGVAAIQISPANEVIDTPTWWARYQPVTFDKFDGRSGTKADMKEMLARCNAVGVKVYADVVINHTADYGGEGTGTAGTKWRIKHHPRLTPKHYHAQCTIKDYSNTFEVQNCQLGALPDLDTSSPYVQTMLNEYVTTLGEFGFAGFRIDAAKHISPIDLEAILEGVNQWRFLEVIGNDQAPAALQPPAYAHLGAVTDFAPSYQFRQVLEHTDWRKLSIDDVPYESVDFVDNHDTERHGARAYQHGASDELYRQAQIVLLLTSNGYPKLLSGFKYDDKDAMAPAAVPCSGSWRCWHRDPQIQTAIALRKETAQLSIDYWSSDNDGSTLVFSRSNALLAFVNSGQATEVSVPKFWQDKPVINRIDGSSIVLKDTIKLAQHSTLLLTSK